MSGGDTSTLKYAACSLFILSPGAALTYNLALAIPASLPPPL